MMKRAEFLGLMLLGLAGLAPQPLWAQSAADAPGGVYTCVDAKGRTLTSDRFIPECSDREQRLLAPTGNVRKIVGPALTGPERAAKEAAQRREAEEKARQQEEKRRERALLTRYPTRAAHDKERAEALSQIATVRAAAVRRVEELGGQRKELDAELEFYAQNPSRVPPSLKRLVDENADSMEVQQRFIAAQDAETKRVNTRFDEELTRLQPLWAQIGTN